jgi:uncharacterized protein
MKIVLDTNVLISALIRDGKPRLLLSEILRRQELVISREILEEVAIVAAEERTKRYVGRRDTAGFPRDISSTARIARVRSRFSAVKEDPDDDIILRTAFDGKKRYIVSGDTHLLDMRNFHRIRIIAVEEMMEILADQPKI